MEGAVKYCSKRKMTKTDLHACVFGCVMFHITISKSYASQCEKKTFPIHCVFLYRNFPNIKPPGRKCIYNDKDVKYLVQVRDDVEAGDKKMKELEQEMKEWGIFDSDFCLGDIFDEEEPDQGDGNQQKAKKKLSEFPVLEGEESIVEYVGQYKKACLSKKALLKSTRERLEKDQSKGHERLHFVSEVLISPILITLFWCPQMKKIMHAFFPENNFLVRKDLKMLEDSGGHSVKSVLPRSMSCCTSSPISVSCQPAQVG